MQRLRSEPASALAILSTFSLIAIAMDAEPTGGGEPLDPEGMGHGAGMQDTLVIGRSLSLPGHSSGAPEGGFAARSWQPAFLSE